jgi:nitrogen fixation/metabolism regulation signal transduction histidine kinase
MEDHGGALKLFDATKRPGARAVLRLPRLKTVESAASVETAAE